MLAAFTASWYRPSDLARIFPAETSIKGCLLIYPCAPGSIAYFHFARSAISRLPSRGRLLALAYLEGINACGLVANSYVLGSRWLATQPSNENSVLNFKLVGTKSSGAESATTGSTGGVRMIFIDARENGAVSVHNVPETMFCAVYRGAVY